MILNTYYRSGCADKAQMRPSSGDNVKGASPVARFVSVLVLLRRRNINYVVFVAHYMIPRPNGLKRFLRGRKCVGPYEQKNTRDYARPARVYVRPVSCGGTTSQGSKTQGGIPQGGTTEVNWACVSRHQENGHCLLRT